MSSLSVQERTRLALDPVIAFTDVKSTGSGPGSLMTTQLNESPEFPMMIVWLSVPDWGSLDEKSNSRKPLGFGFNGSIDAPGVWGLSSTLKVERSPSAWILVHSAETKP